MSPSARRVALTYGRFDGFHQHHVRFLQQVSLLADEVIVGCATDACALSRGTACRMSFETRRGMLQGCRYVTRVIAQVDPDQTHTDIVNYNVSLLVMGQAASGHYDHLQNIAQVLYLPRGPLMPAGFRAAPVQKVVGY